ncbi:MAG: DUF4124 domain-containing protein [Betaproteobacteria bacterium]|nr:DUF4124 domain-containing protein [Betaproteobacteria bacterium]
MRAAAASSMIIGMVCLAAACANAQTLYKNVMPDGRVIYSDQPLKGATQSKALESPPPPSADQKAAAQKRADEEKRKRNELETRLDARRKAAQTAEDRVTRARKALEDAQVALERGREPQPGEMTGNAGGGVRPNEAYMHRQAELERNVENARKDLDDALRARNETR